MCRWCWSSRRLLRRPILSFSCWPSSPSCRLLLFSVMQLNRSPKTGDAIGGLLNATLGNLTELIIALTALHAGQYMLVKASIAGAIVTNSLFMLGASFLLGGLRYHVQEYNRAGGRLYSGLLLMATIALVAPSAVAELDLAQGEALAGRLSLGLAVLLIVAYGLGLLFSLKTHKELFAERGSWRRRARHCGRSGLRVGHTGCCHGVRGAGERGLRRVRAKAAEAFGMTPAFVGFIVVALVGAAAEMAVGVFGRAQEPAGPERRHRARKRVTDRPLRRPSARPAQLCHRPGADGSAVLAGAVAMVLIAAAHRPGSSPTAVARPGSLGRSL